MQLPRPQTRFEPQMSNQDWEALYARWQRAVARAMLDGTSIYEGRFYQRLTQKE